MMSEKLKMKRLCSALEHNAPSYASYSLASFQFKLKNKNRRKQTKQTVRWVAHSSRIRVTKLGKSLEKQNAVSVTKSDSKKVMKKKPHAHDRTGPCNTNEPRID